MTAHYLKILAHGGGALGFHLQLGAKDLHDHEKVQSHLQIAVSHQ